MSTCVADTKKPADGLAMHSTMYHFTEAARPSQAQFTAMHSSVRGWNGYLSSMGGVRRGGSAQEANPHTVPPQTSNAVATTQGLLSNKPAAPKVFLMINNWRYIL